MDWARRVLCEDRTCRPLCWGGWGPGPEHFRRTNTSALGQVSGAFHRRKSPPCQWAANKGEPTFAVEGWGPEGGKRGFHELFSGSGSERASLYFEGFLDSCSLKPSFFSCLLFSAPKGNTWVLHAPSCMAASLHRFSLETARRQASYVSSVQPQSYHSTCCVGSHDPLSEIPNSKRSQNLLFLKLSSQ